MKINALIDNIECRCIALSQSTDVLKKLISAIIERDDCNILIEKLFEIQEVELLKDNCEHYSNRPNRPYVLTKNEKATDDSFLKNKSVVVTVSFNFNDVEMSKSRLSPNCKGKISVVPILTPDEVSYIKDHPKDPLWHIRIKPTIDCDVRCIPMKMSFMQELALMNWGRLSLKDLQNLKVTMGSDHVIRNFSKIGVELHDEEMELFVCRACSEEEAVNNMKPEMRSFISRFAHLWFSDIYPHPYHPVELYY